MLDFSRPLGDAVRQARNNMCLTQNELAETIQIDGRTILNIENYKGNPKMEILYPLIRILKIDPSEVFYPEIRRASPAIQQLRLLLEDCSEQEAEVLIPVLESVIQLLRNKQAIEIK